jgi:addiction module HigA family antidote
MNEPLELIAPGEILLEEFMRPHAISQNRLSRDIDVPVARINEIVKGKRAITADTALRLASTLAPRPNSGSACKWSMTSAEPDAMSGRRLNPRSAL